jgi:SWI/SNF-related matrix-associated actin-dependent regulator 1 of chromatin subfamily A
MSEQTLKPTVPAIFRLQIKEFGNELKQLVLGITDQEAYEIAFMEWEFNMSPSEYNGQKSWYQWHQNKELLTGKLMEQAIKMYQRPDFKQLHKRNSKHVKRCDLSDYISRRLTYNDWEVEIETENTIKKDVFSKGSDVDYIHDVIEKSKARRTIGEEMATLDGQRKFNQIWIEDDMFIVKFNYTKNLVEAVKALPGRSFNADRKIWTVPTIYSNEIKEFALQQNFTFHKHASEYLYASKDKINESYQTSADITVPGFKIEPYPYQKAGIYFGIKRKKVLIADEMGLGKTCQAMGIVIHEDAFPCIVICPKSLLMNWKNEWRKFTKFDPFVYYQTKHDIKSVLRLTEVIIVNYEGLKKLEAHKHLFKSIVIDESHYVKSKATQRYRTVFNFAEGKEVRCLLTGTPIMNRPHELIPQLKILGMLKDPKTESNFKSRYCGSSGNDAQNLEELNIKLRSTVMIRREKADVLTELPDFTRNFISVDIDTREEYDMAENNFVTYLKEVKQMSDRKIRAAMNAEILVRMGVLKQISARGKLNQIKEFVDNCFEEEQKVILFAHHREVLNHFATTFNTNMLITGDTKPENRQKIVDRFQNDKNEKIIILSIRAASVGLTLTAASIEVFAEFDWNPAIHDQAEARAHRIGQKDHVNAYYFEGNKTIDEDIISIINYKRTITSQATGTNSSATENNTIIQDLLKKRYDYNANDDPEKVFTSEN